MADDISDSEKREIFRKRFVEVMTDMGKSVHKDPESLYLIGSLAAHLIDRAKVPDWASLKAALSQEAYTGLLNSFQTQATEHVKNGNQKAAYAIEILAISVICMTQRGDAQLASGEELLDKLIGDTVGLFRRTSGKTDTAPQPN